MTKIFLAVFLVLSFQQPDPNRWNEKAFRGLILSVLESKKPWVGKFEDYRDNSPTKGTAGFSITDPRSDLIFFVQFTFKENPKRDGVLITKNNYDTQLIATDENLDGVPEVISSRKQGGPDACQKVGLKDFCRSEYLRALDELERILSMEKPVFELWYNPGLLKALAVKLPRSKDPRVIEVTHLAKNLKPRERIFRITQGHLFTFMDVRFDEKNSPLSIRLTWMVETPGGTNQLLIEDADIDGIPNILDLNNKSPVDREFWGEKDLKIGSKMPEAKSAVKTLIKQLLELKIQ